MGLGDTIRTLAQMPTLLKLKKGMVPRAPDVTDSFSARVEANACVSGSGRRLSLRANADLV